MQKDGKSNEMEFGNARSMPSMLAKVKVRASMAGEGYSIFGRGITGNLTGGTAGSSDDEQPLSPGLLSPTQLEELKDEVLSESKAEQSTLLSEAKRYADQVTSQVELSLLDAIESSKHSVTTQVMSTASSVEATSADLASTRQEMSSLKAVLESVQEQMKSIMNSTLPRLRSQVEENSQAVATYMERSRTEHNSLGEALYKLTQESADHKDATGQLHKSMCGEMQRYEDFTVETQSAFQELKRSKQELHSRLTEELARLKEDFTTLRSEHSQRLESISSANHSRLQAVEDRTIEIQKASLEVLGMPVRRVECVISDAADFLNDVSKACECLRYNKCMAVDLETPLRSWLSPEFEAGGAGRLQLELQVFPNEQLSTQEISSAEIVDLEVRVLLRAPEGVHICMKLHFGTVITELRHYFDGESECATERFLLRDGINELSNVISMGIELLEVFQTRELKGREDDSVVKGSLCFLRHSCPGVSQTVATLEDEINLVRSRLIGRVEWVLQEASLMPDFFPQGSYLCSPFFSAGGIDGLQLIFYPSGEVGATSCMCSLYLHSPGRSRLQCWLSIGKQRKELLHPSKDKPGFFGRCNFAIYQNCIDKASDSLLLALEIGDAQCSGSQSFSYEPAPKIIPWPESLTVPLSSSLDSQPKLVDELTSSLVSSAEEAGEALASWCHPPLFEHTARIYGRPGRLAFQDVKILPPIFTLATRLPSQLEGANRVKDGMWNFDSKVDSGLAHEGFFRSSDLRSLRLDLKAQPPHDGMPASARGDLAPLKQAGTVSRPQTNEQKSRREGGSPVKAALSPTKPLQSPQHAVNRPKHGRVQNKSSGSPSKLPPAVSES